MLLLFGSAFAAYATADTLTAGTVTLAPIQIGAFLNGNVISGEEHVGYAIGFGMLIVLSVVMVLYALVRKKGVEMASIDARDRRRGGAGATSSRDTGGPTRRRVAGARSASGGSSSSSSPGCTSSSRSMPGMKFSFENDADHLSLYAIKAIPSADRVHGRLLACPCGSQPSRR